MTLLLYTQLITEYSFGKVHTHRNIYGIEALTIRAHKQDQRALGNIINNIYNGNIIIIMVV